MQSIWLTQASLKRGRVEGRGGDVITILGISSHPCRKCIERSVHVCGFRYDYQPADLRYMLEILACIKGVACILQQADPWMSGYLFQAVYMQMQSFVQLALTHTESRDKVMPLRPTPHLPHTHVCLKTKFHVVIIRELVITEHPSEKVLGLNKST